MFWSLAQHDSSHMLVEFRLPESYLLSDDCGFRLKYCRGCLKSRDWQNQHATRIMEHIVCESNERRCSAFWEAAPAGFSHLLENAYISLNVKSVSFLLSNREDFAKALTWLQRSCSEVHWGWGSRFEWTWDGWTWNGCLRTGTAVQWLSVARPHL